MMTVEKKHNESPASRRSRANTLVNVGLTVGLLLLIICQALLFTFTLRDRTKTAATLQDGTGGGVVTTASSALQLTSCSDDDLVDAVSAVKFAIVNIDVASSDVSPSRRPSTAGLNFDTPSPQALASNTETVGSGIIVNNRGYVLTCYHLIETNPKVYVTVFSAERKSYLATLIDVDVNNDLAVLKIDGGTFPTATLGNSDMVKVIDTVLAIGSPFGFEHTVTEGVVSDNKRSVAIGGRTYVDIFQTDAAVNRGSAGGALMNSAGEVVGVNTAIASTSGYFAGISFAIPINRARLLLMRAIDG